MRFAVCSEQVRRIDGVKSAVVHGVFQVGCGDLESTRLLWAKAAGKFEMRQQSELHYSWSTTIASSFWDMRLSAACAATDAEYQNQNRIIQRNRSLSFPVVARHPHPDRNLELSALRGATGGMPPSPRCLRAR